MLGEAGYEVVATVDNLAEAVRVIQEEKIDLILSDIKLNGDGDGMDVARAAAAKGSARVVRHRQLPDRGADARDRLSRETL
jgi:CheY-like chemotaxis protein